MLSALQSQQEGLHTPMLRMVPAEGTMMLFDAKAVILGNPGTGEQARSPGGLPSDHRDVVCSHFLHFTGWFGGTHGP